MAVFNQAREVYLLALQLAAELDDGQVALEVVEAARADAVARALRGGRLAVGGDVGRLLGRMRALEQGVASAAAHVAAKGAGASSLRTRLAAVQACRAELDHLSGPCFATAWAPPSAAADPEEIRRGLPDGAHAVVYELDESDPEHPVAHVVWLSPAAGPVVELSLLDGPVAELVMGYGNRHDTMADEHDGVALALAGASLLPKGLLALLEARAALMEAGEHLEPIDLVIVPASRLWAFPWAALHVGGRRLVELASHVLVPTLGIQAAIHSRSAPPEGDALVCFGSVDDRPAGLVLERQALQEVFGGAEVPAGELLGRLRQTRYSHVVLTAVRELPGEHTEGLDQGLHLGEGVVVRAGDMLAAKLAGTLTVATCWGGAAIAGAGLEPCAWPAVALCVGATAVCGGILPLSDEPTGELLAGYYRLLARGDAPHVALRSAQLGYLDERPDAPPAEWAGLVVIGHAGPSRRSRTNA
jgi:hypothetical protein